MKHSIYTHRELARVEIVAASALHIGSGEGSILTDAAIIRDNNGLPYIPASSIAGILHSMLKEKEAIKELWGYQKDEKGKGSEIIFTEARILNSKGDVMDGIVDYQTVIANDPLLNNYEELPVRQHVSITAKGTGGKGGKFDEQVVYAGTRFYFEIEILTDGTNTDKLKDILSVLRSEQMRIGGGTTKGLGKIEVTNAEYIILDLRDAAQRACYMNKSTNLALSKKWWDERENRTPIEAKETGNRIRYQLKLKPKDFFLFGAGFGSMDGTADNINVTEKCIEWNQEGKVGTFTKKKVLIPASSVKGCLRHRVAYHYNRLSNLHYGDEGASDAIKSKAVRAIFGDTTRRGHIDISDIYLERTESVLRPHVRIDNFTGGAQNGALFTESVEHGSEEFVLNILVDSTTEMENDKNILASLESAMEDLCKGRLPLGGSTNRGYGMFNGSLKKN